MELIRIENRYEAQDFINDIAESYQSYHDLNDDQIDLIYYCMVKFNLKLPHWLSSQAFKKLP